MSNPIEALKKAKAAGATTFAITNCETSKIHTNADYKVLADAGVEASIAATKSFTAQLLILYVFAMKLAEGNLGKDLTDLKKEFVALVGPSGGGKTTICHLLPRFYNIEKGEILNYTFGDLAVKTGKDDEAILYFTKSLDINSNNIDAKIGMAKLLCKKRLRKST